MKPSKAIVVAGGSLISAVMSFLPLSCCAFPVVFSFLGVGGLAFAAALMPYRPYFIALAVAFLGAGFYFAWRPGQSRTVCANPQRRKLHRIGLWVIAVLTLALIAFPYLLPYLQIG